MSTSALMAGTSDVRARRTRISPVQAPRSQRRGYRFAQPIFCCGAGPIRYRSSGAPRVASPTSPTCSPVCGWSWCRCSSPRCSSATDIETFWRIIAFVVFAVAVITDRLRRGAGPGLRHGHRVRQAAPTRSPTKLLIGAALIGLSMLGDLPWWVTVVIMVREIGVTVLRFAVLRRGVIPASRGGKLKTLVQAVAIGLFVLPLSGAWLTEATWVLMWPAVVLTVLTGLDYVVSAVRDCRVTRRRQPDGGRREPTDYPVAPSTVVPMTALMREVIGDVLRQARTDAGPHPA